MADTRTGTQLSNSTTSSTKSLRGRVVVFELDTSQRTTSSVEKLGRKHITPTYSYDIKRWQRHVDVQIPTNEKKKEASVHIATVQMPARAYLGRIFGDYRQMWAVSAA
ncbi:hypothetical protein BGZ61DRAFT_478892 [Ilyonectria robusta]|uniref:uncharacterized protein n=1 Tax=Ilyonectria robusta TaxID=1079257 RepID=UPI001E8ED399|nr:uncharacterized protein BGZ61DRAFT_478892 [Ilyonectria robusta]KAH8688573.1 hypothetical protein BGZ61DRAFT_478892 [Ilyonectria robusta]